MRSAIVGSALLVAALALTGCSESQDENGLGDAPISTWDPHPAEIVNMPDDYGNLAVKCHRGNLLYVTTHRYRYASNIWVLPNHPSCKTAG
mgnify:FL=1